MTVTFDKETQSYTVTLFKLHADELRRILKRSSRIDNRNVNSLHVGVYQEKRYLVATDTHIMLGVPADDSLPSGSYTLTVNSVSKGYAVLTLKPNDFVLNWSRVLVKPEVEVFTVARLFNKHKDTGPDSMLLQGSNNTEWAVDLDLLPQFGQWEIQQQIDNGRTRAYNLSNINGECIGVIMPVAASAFD